MGRYVVTGGMGFIGSNIARELIARGHEVVIVDNPREDKVANVADLNFLFLTPEMFLTDIYHIATQIDGVFHQGACTDTGHPDPKHVIKQNFIDASQVILKLVDEDVKVVYASSAAVYGNSHGEERPLNVYAFSKLQLDRAVMKTAEFATRLVGLRYFNVYGPGESHKGKMSSPIYRWFEGRYRDSAYIPIVFGSYGGFSAGQHARDFVHVSDVVSVNMHAMFNKVENGIYDVGTGCPETFENAAHLVLGKTSPRPFARPIVHTVDFPEHLKGKYQVFTKANRDHMTKMGYTAPFKTLEEGFEASKSAWIQEIKRRG